MAGSLALTLFLAVASDARIVSLVPSGTELLFALGAGNSVVAVSRFDDYPPEVRALPQLGGLGEVGVESILAHHPTAVLSSRSAAFEALHQRLATHGVQVVELSGESFEDLLEDVARVAELVHAKRAGTALASKLSGALQHWKALNPCAGRRVVVRIATSPGVVAAESSYIGYLVEQLGCQIEPAQSTSAFPSLSPEGLLSLEPELIIDLSATRGDRSWKGIAVLPSQAQALMRPGPRVVNGLEVLAKELRDRKKGTR